MSRHGRVPFSGLEWALAWRYLRARRQHGGVSMIAVISFIGIMLAVAVLIVVMSIMNGFRAELMDRILGINGHVYVASQAIGDEAIEAQRQRLAALTGVERAMPLVDGQVLVTFGQASTGVFVRGIRPADLKTLPSVADNIRLGLLDGFGQDVDQIVLGERLAARLGVVPGDWVTLVSPNGAATPFGVAPRKKSYEVVATFAVGMAEYDEVFAFMPLDQAQLFFNMKNKVQQFELHLKNPNHVARIRPEIEAIAGAGNVSDWRERNQSFFNALMVERNAMRMILMMVVAIAAMNIISGLVMLVKNKGRDIAILRTMGLTRGGVMRVFLLIGASLGVAGALGGLVLGLLITGNADGIHRGIAALTGVDIFSADVYFLSHIPVKYQWSEIIGVVVWAAVMSVLAAYFPARRAAKLDPVEALRYE